MEPEAVLNLIDSFWFYPKMSYKQPNSPAPEPQHVLQKDQENSATQKASSQLSIHSRSRSHDQIMIKTEKSVSPDSSSVLSKPQLVTILSEKEISQEIPRTSSDSQEMKRHIRRFRKTRRSSSKSLSELEFEEVKGFMDLGFVFSEDDYKDSSLAEIIPGLNRYGHRNDGEMKEEIAAGDDGVEEFGGSRARPYLSEAWEMLEKEKLLINWRVPSVSNEIDIKDSLKLWAHTVASAVR